jgi:hypothetical protein
MSLEPVCAALKVDDVAPARKHLCAKACSIDGARVVSHAEESIDALVGIAQTGAARVIADLRLRSDSGGLTAFGAPREQGAGVVTIGVIHPVYPQRKRACATRGAYRVFDKHHRFAQVRDVVRMLVSKAHPAKSSVKLVPGAQVDTLEMDALHFVQPQQVLSYAAHRGLTGAANPPFLAVQLGRRRDVEHVFQLTAG